MSIKMDNILSAKLGDEGEILRAAFKKTVYIKKYETEVTELESIIKLPEPISSEERIKKAALIQAQLEYTILVGLVYKGQITPQEFNERKTAIEAGVATIINSQGNTPVKMEDILGASLGEQSGRVRATFRKTICAREFEPEVVEMESILEMPTEITGAERSLTAAILRAQLEYTGYKSLEKKGFVTPDEVTARIAMIENEISALKQKAEAITGKSMDKYF